MVPDGVRKNGLTAAPRLLPPRRAQRSRKKSGRTTSARRLAGDTLFQYARPERRLDDQRPLAGGDNEEKHEGRR